MAAFDVHFTTFEMVNKNVAKLLRLDKNLFKNLQKAFSSFNPLAKLLGIRIFEI